jgi:hypothetical protein
MGFVLAAFLIILGAFAASSLVLGKKPELKETMDKLRQYEGYMGVVGCLWGVWMIISALLNLGVLKHAPIWWVTWLASAVVLALLGFMSGFGLITGFAAKTPEAKVKAEAARLGLETYKNPLGLAGMGLGVWCILAQLIL